MTTGYLVYVSLVISAFVLWAIVLHTMRNFKKGKPADEAKGAILAGPAHLIFRNRKYRLTAREVVGWGIVCLLMLAVPLVSRWLEA